MAPEPMTYPEHFETIKYNVSLGNDYRKEWIKHAMTLGAGVFAFTVSFYKEFPGVKDLPADPTSTVLLCLGWAGIIASLYFGIKQLRGWEDFYMTFRDDPKAFMARDEAQKLRESVSGRVPDDPRRVEVEKEAQAKDEEGKKWREKAETKRTSVLGSVRYASSLQVFLLIFGFASLAGGFGYDLWRAAMHPPPLKPSASTSSTLGSPPPAPAGSQSQSREK